MALSVLWVGAGSAVFESCATAFQVPIRVHRLETAGEAVDALAADARAVVLLDGALGPDACAEIHARAPHVPVLVFGAAEAVARGLAAGAEAGLVAPLVANVVVAQVLALARRCPGARLPDEAIESAAQAVVGQLARGLAHELNNPVSFILANLRTLRGYQDDITKAFPGAVPPQLVEVLEDLGPLVEETLEGAGRIQDLIQVLREFARVEAGEPEGVDVHEALEAAARLAGPELKHHVRVERRFAPKVRAFGWPVRMRQLFAHLVLSAARSLAPAEGERPLVIDTASDGVQVMIGLSAPQGLSPGLVERVWAPFFEGKPVTEDPALLLAAAGRIARLHSGELGFTPGEARLWVRLPAEPPLPAKKTPGSATAAGPASVEHP